MLRRRNERRARSKAGMAREESPPSSRGAVAPITVAVGEAQDVGGAFSNPSDAAKTNSDRSMGRCPASIIELAQDPSLSKSPSSVVGETKIILFTFY